MDLLGWMIVSSIIGVAFAPASFGETIAKVVKGYRKEITTEETHHATEDV
jgi:hypothetical protein